MLMVRFFCDEMGLYLPKGASEPKDRTERDGKQWQPGFKCKRFTVAEAKKDRKKFDSLVKVLKAANRAVAHINEVDVDHPIKTENDHSILFDSISWIQELIQSHMYEPNGRLLKDAMALRDNVM